MPVLTFDRGCGTHVGEDDPIENVRVDFIPQGEQRYDTVGDYTGHAFRISQLPKTNYSWAIMLHELVEKRLCHQAGITDEMIDAWDLAHPELDDPGLHPDCPYHTQHMKADSIERMFIILAGEDWIAYEEAISSLFLEGA